jgi:transcriptional regulator with XRE-family HTH domain
MKKYKETVFTLKTVLKEKEVTQYRLAKLLDVETNHVTRWCKKDHNPTLKTMNRIAEALNCKVSDLLTNKKLK